MDLIRATIGCLVALGLLIAGALLLTLGVMLIVSLL
jgi:hypothetical protein